MSLKNITKKFNKKTVFAILSMLVVAITFIFAVFSCMNYVLTRIGIIKSEAPVVANISFKEEYPFADAEEASEPGELSNDFVSSYATFASTFVSRMKRFSTEENLLAPTYYNIYGAFNRLINKNLIENSEKNVYCLENGTMVYADDWQLSEYAAGNIVDFADWLENRNTDFIYVLTASKDDDSVISFPPTVKKNYAEGVEKFTELLDSRGIKYLDVKKMLLSKDDNFFDWFYKTDHHCTVRAGIATADQIVNCLADDFGYNVDKSVCDLSNYKSIVYEEFFLGSMGRKTTLGYTKADDFEILYPKFDTNFRIEVPAEFIDKTGNFEDTMIDKTQIKSGDYGNDYGAFLYADQSLIQITNNICHNGIRVLVLKQSKANNINPYLACAVEQLDIIDPRSFDGSIRTYVEKTKPDLVIICAMPDLDNESSWSLK